jgi:hypothetical protein
MFVATGVSAIRVRHFIPSDRIFLRIIISKNTAYVLFAIKVMSSHIEPVEQKLGSIFPMAECIQGPLS